MIPRKSMILEYGDLLVCIDNEDIHFLQIGVVSDKDIKDFDTETITIKYRDNTTSEYERWKMSGYFKRILSETVIDY